MGSYIPYQTMGCNSFSMPQSQINLVCKKTPGGLHLGGSKEPFYYKDDVHGEKMVVGSSYPTMACSIRVTRLSIEKPPYCLPLCRPWKGLDRNINWFNPWTKCSKLFVKRLKLSLSHDVDMLSMLLDNILTNCRYFQPIFENWVFYWALM